ncbi:hypothetical protein B0919_23285 [Hymenobacter sp. CRA2]|nr:hypothetical protein B0919_23285 [Hymenobacter sp. CRA2]
MAAQVVVAQTTTVGLNGSVRAGDKTPITQAAVTVVHQPSGLRRAVLTDARGEFAFAELMAGGPYIIQVSQPGYKPQLAENVFLSPEKPSNLAFTLLKPGAPAPGRASGQGATKAATAAKPGTTAYIEQVPRTSTRPVPAGATASIAPASAPAAARPAMPAPASTTAADEPPRTYRYTAPRPNYRAAAVAKAAPKGVAPAVSGHYDAKSGNYIYETGAPATLKLAGGGKLEGVGISSTESLLHRFITDAQAQVDTVDLTKGWINFDRVFFEPGKASLTKESMQQLRNIAALLHAYPNTRIKIGGYTDSTGTYKVNRQLSEARARSAWAALVDLGIGASRMDARGYGPRYAIAPNTTEEGRAMNRRLSIKVLQK